MLLNRVGLTQFSVVQIIHRNVGLKCFLFTYIFAIVVSFCFHWLSTR